MKLYLFSLVVRKTQVQTSVAASLRESDTVLSSSSRTWSGATRRSDINIAFIIFP